MENQTDAFSSYWMEKENPTRDFASFETFLFWFGFCAIRVLSTFGSRYIQPRSMLWANLIGLSLSSIGLFFSTNPLFSTFCIFLFGCSIATCFPTAIAFAQTKTDVTGRVRSYDSYQKIRCTLNAPQCTKSWILMKVRLHPSLFLVPLLVGWLCHFSLAPSFQKAHWRCLWFYFVHLSWIFLSWPLSSTEWRDFRTILPLKKMLNFAKLKNKISDRVRRTKDNKVNL